MTNKYIQNQIICNFFSVGSDECDTATSIFRCADKEGPDVVFEAVSNTMFSPTAVIAIHTH
jgi:hypothetical protein